MSAKTRCNKCGNEIVPAILYEDELGNLEHGYVTQRHFVECQVCHDAFVEYVFVEYDTNGLSYDYGYSPIRKKIFWDEDIKDFFTGRHATKASITSVAPPIQSLSNPKLDIYGMYTQIIEAINTGLYWLAHSGMRNIIEAICIDKFGVKHGKFTDMEREINTCDRLSPELKTMITDILDSGQSATHRGFNPTEYQIVQCIKGVEIFIKRLFDFDLLKQERLKAAKLPGKSGKTP